MTFASKKLVLIVAFNAHDFNLIFPFYTVTFLLEFTKPVFCDKIKQKDVKGELTLKSFALHEVTVTEPAFVAAWKADVIFIKRLDPDRLLSAFRRSAGLPDQGKKPYGGWEDGRIGGHTMGHYLAACAQEIAATGDTVLRERVDYIIEELAKCQERHGNGFLFGAKLDPDEEPERQFDIEEGKLSMEGFLITWVPWYTMHKIFDGLLTVHRLCNNEKALEVAERLGDWVVQRVSKWSGETRRVILGKEYGGMNDCLYQLWHASGKEQYRKAAEIFDDKELMERFVADEPDTLAGHHANTTIPKFLGGMEEHPKLAERFWDRVTERHAYATGGISDIEHFHEDFGLDARRTQCNCEGCCAHNMLKLSHRLYNRKPRKKYAEYAERLLFNAILGAIDPSNGTTAYFSPMATGYRKTFGKEDLDQNKFWCCTGTGMENYTKIQDEIYFSEGNGIWVNQYISSELKSEGRILRLDMDWNEDVKAALCYEGDTSEFSLYLRIPSWTKAAPHLECRGTEKEIVWQEDYVMLSGQWEAGDAVSLIFDVEVEAQALPDQKNAVCFTYGPFVLAAKLGRAHWDEETGAGIDVVADAWKVVGEEEANLTVEYGETHRKILDSETIHRKNGEESCADFLKNIHHYMKRLPGDSLRFELTGTDGADILGHSMIFVPYYEITDERYGIYWYMEE